MKQWTAVISQPSSKSHCPPQRSMGAVSRSCSLIQPECLNHDLILRVLTYTVANVMDFRWAYENLATVPDNLAREMKDRQMLCI